MLRRLGKATASRVEKGGVMRLLLIALLALVGMASQSLAEDFSIVIKDHRFEPAEIQVPTGQTFTLTVTNQDASPEEFESTDLDIEKVIAGDQSAAIKIEPLDVGRYEFYGEYHQDSAKGAIIAK